MHVTPAKQDVESCDRVGLIEAMPAGDAEGDPSGRRWTQRVDLMRDSIIYNRNNPSILFYESGNKGISEDHMREMKAVRDQFDPHGGRLIGSREMLGSQVAEYGGEMLYINKSAGKPVWAHEYNRDEGARKFWNNQTAPFHPDSPLYNRNQESFTLEDILRWDDYFRARPGTGRRVSSGGANISWIDENSHFRGDNNYRRSGEVDAMRIPKDAFYAHQTMWDGWVNPEFPRIHILGHWNYSSGAPRTVYVVANTASVELLLNGHSLGTQMPTHDFLFTFQNVNYQSGTLEAVGYDVHHSAIVRTKLETATAPLRIRLTPHIGPGGLHADGADLALLDVEVVDAQGRRVPTAMDKIHFSLQGEAEWRGGIAQGAAQPTPINTEPQDTHGLAKTAPAPYLHDDNYILSLDLPVEGGINRVSIRSTTHAGSITVKASADGLQPATLTLASTAVTVANGLSAYLPTDALPLNLERGPTPALSSIRLTRTPVAIVAATAGANAAESAAAYDDNESTAWSNAVGADSDPSHEHKGGSGSLDQAWIEFTLAQPVRPTEMDIKLGNFRLREYPLQITLDGKVIFEGMTPTSLGYITLPLHCEKPGSKLRIRLVGLPVDVQEEHALVEVSGKIDQAQPKGKSAHPVLSVHEVEVYTAATPQ